MANTFEELKVQIDGMKDMIDVLPDFLREKFETAFWCFNKYLNLDHNLVETVQELANFDKAEVHQSETYDEVALRSKPNESAFYFPQAGLVRFYTPEEIKKHFVNRIRTYYKKYKVYEVIHNNQPHRVFLTLQCSPEDLEVYQGYVLDFLKVKKTTGTNIIMFDVDGIYEMVIDYKVNNAGERLQFIKELTNFVRIRKKDAEFGNRLTQTDSDFYSASMLLVPELKRSLNGAFGEGYVTRFDDELPAEQ